MHQHDTSVLGQEVAKSKGIPVFETAGEALMLGGEELAVDGVVIVAEHGDYPTDLKGHWLLPRWWIFQQVVSVFEKSKRSVPVFNDKRKSSAVEQESLSLRAAAASLTVAMPASCLPVVQTSRTTGRMRNGCLTNPVS
jgi:hypothetical protein